MKQQLVERELTPVRPRRKAGVVRRKRSVTVNLAESPLSWLYARGHLEERLFDAGERLRADYERAQLPPSITMRWEPVRIRGTADRGLDATERQIAARARFDGAMAAAGKGLQDILWRVVCAGEGLPDAERCLNGLRVAASWSCAWRSKGWPSSTGSGGRASYSSTSSASSSQRSSASSFWARAVSTALLIRRNLSGSLAKRSGSDRISSPRAIAASSSSIWPGSRS